MSKNVLIFLVVLLISSVIYIYVGDRNDDDFEALEQAEEKAVIANEGLTVKALEAGKLNDTVKNNPASAVDEKQNSPKIPYDGNWCIRNVDLTEDDLRFAQQESKDWAEKRGLIFFNKKDFNGDFTNERNGDLLEPYKEMPKSQLVEFATNDDRYAMIASLQREDVDSSIQNKIAKRLLELGDTSFGLLHLIITEMVAAQSEFRRKEKITASIKQNLITALSYISYGISRYDTFALTYYLSMVSREDLLKGALDPATVLSSSDFDEVKNNKNRLSASIDEARLSENLSPIGQMDIPKIALVEFEERLALLYLDYGPYLDGLQAIGPENGPSIERTHCVQRYINVFGTHW